MDFWIQICSDYNLKSIYMSSNFLYSSLYLYLIYTGYWAKPFGEIVDAAQEK